MSAPHQTSLFVSQNFLKDPRLVASLIAQSSIGAGDVVYEIGPGKGIITAQLARCCRRVIAVEKDPALAAVLKEKFACHPKVSIQTGDFLRVPLPHKLYKVFSNIPFNITSSIMAKLTEAPNPPEDACLVMQKEAAEMYLGQPHESMRSVLLKPWFKLESVHQFQRGDFTPQPKVDSVLFRMYKRSRPLIAQTDRRRFRDFVVYGFTTWRPNLGEIFKDIFSHRQLVRISREAHIDFGTTPTKLQFEQWLYLFEIFNQTASPQAIFSITGSENVLRRQQRKLQKIHRTRKR